MIQTVKIWIAKNSEVAVSEQLATQITLGIASGDFALGERLPSTREIARRCGVHANTVGSVYRKLTRQKWLEFRQGRGFYVTEAAGERLEGVRQLDRMIQQLFEEASRLGFDEVEVRGRLTQVKLSTSADRVVLIESDRGLRDILVHELESESIPVSAAVFEDLETGDVGPASLLTAMLDEKPKIDAVLANGQRCVYLKGRSVSTALSGEPRPSASDQIAVVSGWDGFLTFARIMLLAAKIDPGNLIVRSTSEDAWKRAIRSASTIVCDSLTASALDGRARVRSFRLISDESLTELRAAIQSGVSS
jgi:GntR family transcriptional regulator